MGGMAVILREKQGGSRKGKMPAECESPLLAPEVSGAVLVCTALAPHGEVCQLLISSPLSTLLFGPPLW